MTERAYLTDVVSRQCFCRSVFAQPRPKADIVQRERDPLILALRPGEIAGEIHMRGRVT
jgi:hypothetical protein